MTETFAFLFSIFVASFFFVDALIYFLFSTKFLKDVKNR